jgi:arginase
MTTAPWTVLGVPIDSVGSPAGGPLFGTELSPAALRGHGIVERLGARDAGDLDVRVTGPDRDAATGLVGGATVAPVVAEVRRATRELMTAGERPLLLGGCCTLLVGAFAGAVDARGALGLAYADGHYDVYDHRTSPTGEVADMPVALLLGRGEPGLLAVAGPTPSLTVERLRVLGARDVTEWDDVHDLVDELGLANASVAQIASDPAGVGAAAADALGGTGFWLSLDVDVLDEVAFPATDYLMPDGLSLEQLHDLLLPLGRDARCVGASVACYNPTKDPGGHGGAALVDLLVDVLGGAR